MSSASAKVVMSDEKKNNATIEIKLKDHLSLTLNSTYWELNPAPASKVKVSSPVIKVILPNQTTRPECQHMGSGCGSKTWDLTFRSAGNYSVIATRNSCGEAMSCTGANGIYKLKVKVIR